MSNTREALFPLMVMSGVPLPSISPSIVRLVVMSSWPLVRTNVPLARPGAKLMTLSAGLKLRLASAVLIASRSEPGPLSLRLVTVIVAMIPLPCPSNARFTSPCPA
jgi:hypothetical protein